MGKKKNKNRGKKGKGSLTVAQESPQGLNELIAQLGLAPAGQAHQIDTLDLDTFTGNEATLGDRHPGTAQGLTFSTLRQMARVDIAGAIIGTRVNQVASFTQPQLDDGQLGYKIRLRDHEAVPTRADKRQAFLITDFMQSCGDNRAVGFEMDFENLTRQVIRDSLILDQASFEVLRTRRGAVAGFVPVDAATIRRVVPTVQERESGLYAVDPKLAFVQIIQHQRVAAWAPHELAFGVRRPRSNIYVNRYGFPELEELMKTLTSIIHAEAYNAQNFTHGMHASGILAIKSKMDVDTFRAFRRYFYAMLQGAFNAKKTPILQLNPADGEEIQSVNLSNTNREMEYQEWMAFLMKVACAIYQMDPAEINFVHGAEGQSGSMTQQGPEMRVQYSKERGLRPLLRSYEKWLNRWVVNQIDPRFELCFVGLEEQLKNSRMERDLKLLGGYMTFNEIRARNDHERIDNPAADMIGNATYMQIAQGFIAPPEGTEGAPQGEEPPAGEGQPEEEGAPTEGGAGEGEAAPEGQQAAEEGATDGAKPGVEGVPAEGGADASESPFAQFFKSVGADGRELRGFTWGD